MTGLKLIVLAAALAAAGAGAASSEIVLESVHWQAGKLERGRVAAWQDVKVLQDGPPKLNSRVRARLSLKNRGPKPEEGILLRYGMTARLTAEVAPNEGAWAIPFIIEEKRVPKVAPNKVIDVAVETGAALGIYLKRLARAGWWPDRVRIQVMLEPHPGVRSIQIVEDVLEVQR